MAARGIAVTGSDRAQGDYMRLLERAGIAVSLGHGADAIPTDCDP